MSHLILIALVPVFFVMALGYLAGRRRMVDNHQVREINALVVDFAVPASLLVATASATRKEMLEQGPLFAALGVIMLMVYLMWYFIERRVLAATQGEAAVQALTVAQPNYAAVGLPIIAALLGPVATVHVAVALAAGSILVTPLTLVLLEVSGGQATHSAETPATQVWRALCRSFTKPVVLAPVIGTLLSLSGVRINGVIGSALELIGQAAGGVALFLTGLVLSAQPFRLDWKVIGATGIANVIRPLLVVILVCIFPVPTEIAKVAILLAALPSGFFGILFGVNYRVATAEVGSTVIASTTFSIATLAGAIALLYPQ